MAADRPDTSHERSSGRAWDHSYRDATPPWDIGRPQSAVVRLADEGAIVQPVLDVGCGTGENALEIARRGLDVTGVDVAPTAIELATQKASSRQLSARFVVADAFRLDQLGQTFQTILDCGLFHTFDDAERISYVDGLAAITTPGSVIHLLCFNDTTPGNGGPRHVSQVELRASFAIGWRVARIEAASFETRISDAGSPAWLAKIERI